MRNMTSSAMLVGYIEVRFFVHATEDQNKVINAVKQILPPKHANNVVFGRKNLSGHYDNPIILFETRIKGKEIMAAFIERLSSNLSQFDKETLLKEFNSRLDEGNLYVRLDKQLAANGEFGFNAADPIHVRIRFKKKKTEDIMQISRILGLLPESIN